MIAAAGLTLAQSQLEAARIAQTASSGDGESER